MTWLSEVRLALIYQTTGKTASVHARKLGTVNADDSSAAAASGQKVEHNEPNITQERTTDQQERTS